MAMQSKKILLLGAGGHCRSVVDSLLSMSCFDEIGLIDNNVNILTEKEECDPQDILKECPLIGGDEDLERLFLKGYTNAFITVGSIGNVTVRRKLYDRLKQIGFHIPNIIDKSSQVSRYAILGEGIYVGKNSVINAGAKIGSCSIINTASVIEHQCEIGEFAHIAPGSVLCGDVKIGANSHIGAGSVLKQGVHIGNGAMIGMGSVVLKDIRDYVTAYGNPCKEV